MVSLAAAIEDAGKTGDIAFVDAKLPMFMDALTRLLASIRGYLNDIHAKTERL